MDGSLDVWVDGWMWMNEWIDGIDGWFIGCICGWVDGWMDG